MKRKDGTTKPFDINNKVVYIPTNLLSGDKNKMIKDEHLGVVTSKNDSYVFVRYKGNTNSQATRPEDLYFLDNRPDLIKLLEDD